MKKIVVFLLMAAMLTSAATGLAEKLTVGTNAEFPPFEYIGDDGTIQGFDADLIAAILDDAGYEHEMVTMDFDALPAALQSGQIDIAIAAMTIREEKKNYVLFSDSYFNASQKLVVLEGSAIMSEADITPDMKIGVQLGTTGDVYVTDNIKCEVVRFTKALDAMLDMKNGRLDAVMVDAAPSEYFAAAIGGLTVLDENLSDEQYGIAVKLGNDALMDIINQGLAKLVEDGTYDKIYQKHFDVKTEAE
ncbi:MAG: basic amino acid ABC transporter substrate-binding protein [Clostridiales bacterium]|jgi:ABC-type amino acid transport substrate-binding protein|nr:basic amino acid ABC transporter substrate-binding protein [Clostridiales bacterium]